MMTNSKIIDVSDLTLEQIAIIEEMVASFRINRQQNDLSLNKLHQAENWEKSSNLAQRIKQRFSSIENVEIPQTKRSEMRTPPQFD